MSEPVTPPVTPPTAPAVTPPVTPPVVPPVAKVDPPAKVDQPPSLTMEQVKQLLSDERKTWETEHVGKLEAAFKKNYEIPKRRDGKIENLRQKLIGAGKHKPADDDNSDKTCPGDLAALALLDDEIIVTKDKDGNGLTLLDIEIRRTDDRLSKRKATKTGDSLETPPIDSSGKNEYDRIREEVAAKHKAATENGNRRLPAMIG